MKNIIEIIMKEAKKAYQKGEVPVGCAIVKNNKVISKAHNTRQKTHKVVDHAEIKCIIKAAKKLRDWRLDNCELYVTLYPCKMCEEIIKQSRIKKIYYLIESNFNDKIKNNIVYKKINDKEDINYAKLLNNFFKNKRQKVEKKQLN